MSEAGFGRALRAFRFAAKPLQGSQPTALTLIPPNPWPGDATRGRTMLSNQIALGGEIIAVTGSPWSAQAHEPWFRGDA